MSRKDAIKRTADRRERGYGNTESYFDFDALAKLGIEVWKSKEGPNFIAVVPPPDPDAYFGYEFFAHYNVGVSGGSFICPRMMKKGKCPLCEEYQRLKGQPDMSEKTLRTLNPFPPRHMFWIIDMQSEETQAQGVQLYDAPMTVNDEILSLSKDSRTGEVIDVSDPVDGFTLEFERAGKGIRTTYRGFKLEERDPLFEDWLEQVVPFEDVVVIQDYDYLKTAYYGEGHVDNGGGDEGEESVDGPRRSSGSRRPARQQRGRVRESLDEIEEDLDEQGEDDGDLMGGARKRMKERLATRRQQRDSSGDDDDGDRAQRPSRSRRPTRRGNTRG